MSFYACQKFAPINSFLYFFILFLVFLFEFCIETRKEKQTIFFNWKWFDYKWNSKLSQIEPKITIISETKTKCLIKCIVNLCWICTNNEVRFIFHFNIAVLFFLSPSIHFMATFYYLLFEILCRSWPTTAPYDKEANELRRTAEQNENTK